MAFNYSNAAKSLGKKIEKKSALAAPSQAVSTDQPVNDGGSFLSRATSATGQALLGFGKFAGQATKDVLLGADIDVFGKKLSVPGVFTRGSNTGLIRSVLNTREGQNLSNIVDEKLKPVGTAQGVGYTAGAIAEAFIPGIGQAGVASKAPTLLKAYPKLARWTPVVARGVSEGVETLGVTARQRKEVNDESLREAAYSAVLAPLGKIPRVAVGSTQVGQGVYQMAEGDTMGGATNIAIGLAQAWSGSKTKGLLLDEPVTLIKGRNPQVSGDIEGMKRPASTEMLPTARQRFGARIAESTIRPTKADIDAGFDVKNVAKYDVLRGDLAESLDETQRRISGYNDTVKEVVRKYGDPMVIDAQTAIANVRKNLTGEGKSLSSGRYEKILDEVEESMDTFIPDWRTRKLSAEEGIKLRREAGKQAVFHHDPLNKGENALREQVFNDIYLGMKKELDTNLPPQFQGANEAMSELIPIQHAILRRIPVAERQNVIGLTDSMTSLASIFDPRALAFGAISRATKSPTVARALMQSGPLDKPFMPGDIPEAPNYPRLPAPGDIPYRAPTVIELPSRTSRDTSPAIGYSFPESPRPLTADEMRSARPGQKMLPAPGVIPYRPPTVIELPSRTASTMSSRVPENFPRYTPQQAEALRLKSLEETASRAKDMPIMSRQAAYQDHDIRTMENSRPAQPPDAPNMLAPRSVGEFTPEPVTATSMREEAKALKEQLDAFSYPDSQMEIGYNEFKKIASRSTDILDDITDSDAFIKRYGKEKYRTVIEDSVKGGGLTNDELLDTYRMRYQTEQHVKQRIERMNGKTGSSIDNSDMLAFAAAPMAGIEMTVDENGKPVYKFNMDQSIAGFGLAAGIVGAKRFKGKIPKIDVPTQQEMIDIIDYARLKPGFSQKLENSAAVLAEKYGIKGKTVSDLANKFDIVLQAIKNTKGYPSILKKVDEVSSTAKASGLLSEAKKYKTADEFMSSMLYHGSPQAIKGDKLTYGMKSGQDSGGIFLSDTKDVSNVFSGTSGMMYHASPEIKAKVIDLTTNEGKSLIKSYIGKTYKTMDGEEMQFTKYDFDTMFPNGKTDYASVSQYPELIQSIVDKNKKIGIAFEEYAGGKAGKTYQILNGDVPVKTKEELMQIWNQANKNTP